MRAHGCFLVFQQVSSLSAQGALNADVDGDGAITAADAAAILRYVVGLIDALPILP